MTALRRLRVEAGFLLALWKANLLSAMEYRASFLTQVFGMLLNNAAFLAFWALFFQRFPEVNGWGMTDMLSLYGMTATGFGLGVIAFGNCLTLADIIAHNGLDPYLSLPRPVLLHVLASSSRISGWGDLLTGLICLLAGGSVDLGTALRYGLASLASMTVFVGFLVLVASLGFWLGSATALSGQAIHAILAFATYPLSVFDGWSKLLLYTVIPAAFVGAVPAEVVRGVEGGSLGLLLLAAASTAGLAAGAFHLGLRRYESGGMATGLGG